MVRRPFRVHHWRDRIHGQSTRREAPQKLRRHRVRLHTVPAEARIQPGRQDRTDKKTGGERL